MSAQATGSDNALFGVRVLVVEDEMMLAMSLESMLSEFGCEVVGKACRLDEAVRAAHESVADCAVLDVNLSGQEVFPVCEILAGRGIPFLFGTGYGDADVPDGYRTSPILRKPFIAEQLAAAIKTLMRRK